jgi:hypothetical protein
MHARVGITVYPNIPKNRTFMSFIGTAINPSNDNMPDINIRIDVVMYVLFGSKLRHNEMNASPKKKSHARISMDSSIDGQPNENIRSRELSKFIKELPTEMLTK